MYKIIESAVHNGHLLHRIEATSTMCFGNFIIKPGTKGGWIESESNLGEAVADNAMTLLLVTMLLSTAMPLSRTAQKCMVMRKLAIVMLRFSGMREL